MSWSRSELQPELVFLVFVCISGLCLHVLQTATIVSFQGTFGWFGQFVLSRVRAVPWTTETLILFTIPFFYLVTEREARLPTTNVKHHVASAKCLCVCV